MIALDIAQTLQGPCPAERLQGPGGGPQPCGSHPLCRVAQQLRRQRLPDNHHRRTRTVRSSQVARELDRDLVIESAFVDPEGEPEALVVVDMLLTGFNAPVEQVLYLDRSAAGPWPPPGHRPCQPAILAPEGTALSPRRTYGLVVDYYGVSHEPGGWRCPDLRQDRRPGGDASVMDEDPGHCHRGGSPSGPRRISRVLDLGDTVGVRRSGSRPLRPTPKATSRPTCSRQFNCRLPAVLPAPRPPTCPTPEALDYTERLARLTADPSLRAGPVPQGGRRR